MFCYQGTTVKCLKKGWFLGHLRVVPAGKRYQPHFGSRLRTQKYKLSRGAF